MDKSPKRLIELNCSLSLSLHLITYRNCFTELDCLISDICKRSSSSSALKIANEAENFRHQWLWPNSGSLLKDPSYLFKAAFGKY